MIAKHFDPLAELRPVPAGEDDALEPSSPTSEPPLAYDVYRVADELCIDFDVPGVDPSHIELVLDRQFLTLSIERELAAAGREVIERRRVHGSFQRRLALPCGWNVDELRATYDNGVLHLSAPRRHQEATRHIEVHPVARMRTEGAAIEVLRHDGSDQRGGFERREGSDQTVEPIQVGSLGVHAGSLG